MRLYLFSIFPTNMTAATQLLCRLPCPAIPSDEDPVRLENTFTLLRQRPHHYIFVIYHTVGVMRLKGKGSA